MNTFYLGKRQDFEGEAKRYLRMTVAYKLLINNDSEKNSNNNDDDDDGDDDEQIHYDLKEMIESMNMLLGKLRQHKSLDNDTVDKLRIDASRVKLPHIYFLPDVSKENVLSLVPFITSKYSATWKIGQFINKILQPFVDKTLQSVKFRDEIDFIQKLNHYVSAARRLQSTTLFCSIKITNFYTLNTHQNVIDTVGSFLDDHLAFFRDHLATNKLPKSTILTIKILLHLFLFNNVFCYKEQIYKFTKGSPNTMPLTETLSNIYLYVWTQKI